MDLEKASQAHQEWKIKLRAAIAKKEKVDAQALAVDNRCELGKWLHGDGQRQFGKLAAFGACCEKHAKFHREAAAVAAAINAGRYAEATALLDSAQGGYASASFAVVTALGTLRREVVR